MITSPANERVKAIRKLHERNAREESGLFLIEGLRIVGEAVKQRAPIQTLIVAPDLLKSDFGQNLVESQRKNVFEVLEVSPEVFRRFSVKDGPQGLAAVVRQQWHTIEAISPKEPGDIWVALDSIADPGNLGTILRTADAVGAKGIILLESSTDPYDPQAVRGSMGALFTQTIVRAAFSQFQYWKEYLKIPVVGTSDKAQADYHAYRYPDPLVLLMGSERQGLQPHHLELCDAVVSIPMRGGSDSLNLAVATAVVLYEILNQRRDNP